MWLDRFKDATPKNLEKHSIGLASLKLNLRIKFILPRLELDALALLSTVCYVLR